MLGIIHQKEGGPLIIGGDNIQITQERVHIGDIVAEKLEYEMEKMKLARGIQLDTDLSAKDLLELVELFKDKINRVSFTLGYITLP